MRDSGSSTWSAFASVGAKVHRTSKKFGPSSYAFLIHDEFKKINIGTPPVAIAPRRAWPYTLLELLSFVQRARFERVQLPIADVPSRSEP